MKKSGFAFKQSFYLITFKFVQFFIIASVITFGSGTIFFIA